MSPLLLVCVCVCARDVSNHSMSPPLLVCVCVCMCLTPVLCTVSNTYVLDAGTSFTLSMTTARLHVFVWMCRIVRVKLMLQVGCHGPCVQTSH